jgi:hypothetical protein
MAVRPDHSVGTTGHRQQLPLAKSSVIGYYLSRIVDKQRLYFE